MIRCSEQVGPVRTVTLTLLWHQRRTRARATDWEPDASVSSVKKVQEVHKCSAVAEKAVWRVLQDSTCAKFTKPGTRLLLGRLSVWTRPVRRVTATRPSNFHSKQFRGKRFGRHAESLPSISVDHFLLTELQPSWFCVIHLPAVWQLEVVNCLWLQLCSANADIMRIDHSLGLQFSLTLSKYTSTSSRKCWDLWQLDSYLPAVTWDD